MASQSRRLVVVSNRVVDPRENAAAGGLAVALYEALADNGGLWLGWSGNSSEQPQPAALRTAAPVEFATFDLTPQEIEEYYNGFANQCLWPVLHYRCDLLRFRREEYGCYLDVNQRFADELSGQLRASDLVWIHDYHLIPLAAALKGTGAAPPLGFFLHVPFPPPEVLAALPCHRDLFSRLFAYDVVGFQTERDLACFIAYAVGELGAVKLAGGRLRLGGEEIRAGCFPIGIDVDAFHRDLADYSGRAQKEGFCASLKGRSLIVGVDRLDYSKGLPQRFAAYRQFLADHEAMHKRTLLLQISPPTRDAIGPYAAIQRELDHLEGVIHGEFADIDWSPIRYVKRALPRRRLPSILRAGRVGFVTPLRDGMNLIAKEYVAAQDEADPGVLILSRFAGAAETMQDALIVNPHDIGETAAALHAALVMPLAERRARHKRLLRAVRRHDLDAWKGAFLAELVLAAAERMARRHAFSTLEARSPAPVALSTAARRALPAGNGEKLRPVLISTNGRLSKNGALTS